MQIKILSWFSMGWEGWYGGGQGCGGFGGKAHNKGAKTESLKIIGKQCNLCQCNNSIYIFNLWTDWILYMIRLRHKSTGNFQQ